MSKRDRAKVARKAATAWISHDQNSVETLATALTERETTESIPMEIDVLQQFLDGRRDNDIMANAIADYLVVTLPEINVREFRASGFLPEPLANYLALLGWNPGDDIEQFDRQFLIDRFHFDRINRSNARFDRDKLLAFNADAIRAMEPDCFGAGLSAHCEKHHALLLGVLADRFSLFADAYQARARTLDDPARLGDFFVIPDCELVYDQKSVRKVLMKNDCSGREVLKQVAESLCQLPTWTAAALDDLVAAVAEQGGRKLGDVAQPIRVAVSGNTVSPPLGQTLQILGRKATLARIEHCLATTRESV